MNAKGDRSASSGSKAGRIVLAAADAAYAAGINGNTAGEVNRTIIGVDQDIAAGSISGIGVIARGIGGNGGESRGERPAILSDETDVTALKVAPLINGEKGKLVVWSCRRIKKHAVDGDRCIVHQD